MVGQVRRRGMIILISDLFGEVGHLISGLKHVRHRRHEAIVFHVLDEQELSFPFQEADPLQGHGRLPALFDRAEALRDQYLHELNTFLERVRSECMEHQIDYQRLSTADPLDVALSSYLATRMATSRR